MTTKTSSHHKPPLAAILVVPIIAAVVLTLFAWPSSRLEPRDLPVGVAGPAPAATALEQRLEQRDGAFDVHRYADAAAARAAIEDREVYGAFVATPTGPIVLTASAGSPAVAQALTHAASEAGDAVRVQDVVAAKPAGTGLASSVLPLVLAGILTGVVASAIASGARRAGLLVGGSVLVGLAATGIIQSWLEVVGGNWFANAAGLSLTVLAIAATVAGLERLLGKAGIALGALTMILIGNPFSAVATGPEMLPQPAGVLGQLMPPGAGGNLLRSTGFFDGAAAGGHVTVLAVWALAGLALLFVGAARARRPAVLAEPATA
jgi:hypothetical protein